MALVPIQFDDISSGTIFTKSSSVTSISQNNSHRDGHIAILSVRLSFSTAPTVGSAVTIGTISALPADFCTAVAMDTSSGAFAGKITIRTDGEVRFTPSFSSKNYDITGAYYTNS